MYELKNSWQVIVDFYYFKCGFFLAVIVFTGIFFLHEGPLWHSLLWGGGWLIVVYLCDAVVMPIERDETHLRFHHQFRISTVPIEDIHMLYGDVPFWKFQRRHGLCYLVFKVRPMRLYITFGDNKNGLCALLGNGELD